MYFCTMSPSYRFLLLLQFLHRPSSSCTFELSAFVFSPNNSSLAFCLSCLCFVQKVHHNASLESLQQTSLSTSRLLMPALACFPFCGTCRECECRLSLYFFYFTLPLLSAPFSVFLFSCCFSYFPTYIFTHNRWQPRQHPPDSTCKVLQMGKETETGTRWRKSPKSSSHACTMLLDLMDGETLRQLGLHHVPQVPALGNLERVRLAAFGLVDRIRLAVALPTAR
jgi:hypothetical protein